MKKTIVHRSAAPFYTAAAAWAVYALAFPLYKVGHFVIAAVVTLAVFFVSRCIWKDKKEVIEVEPEPVRTGNEALDKMIADGQLALKEMRRLDDAIDDEVISGQIRQLEEDAQWVAERLERRMNIPAPQREATWPLAAMRAALQTLARERHYQLLLVNGDGHLLAASHALPASVLAQVQAQFPREMQPPLFGSHYQTIQPFAPHQRMLSRALNGNAGLAGWNLVMLAPDGGLPSLLVAYRWPVTIGLGAVLASALLALRQAARARRKR